MRRHLKWSDFVHAPADADVDTPVFLFAEGRETRLAPLTGVYTPTRPSDADLVLAIRNHVNDPQLGPVRVCNWTGRDYVSMAWADRKHFWKAMEAVLLLGIDVSPQCRLAGQWFQPGWRVVPWNPETAERVLVTHLRRQDEKHPYMIDAKRGNLPFWHPNAWWTQEGRAYIQWLRAQAHVTEESSDEEMPVAWLEDGPREQAIVHAVSLPAPVPAQATDATLCVVCMEHAADTLVLPCQHQVCCRGCSDRLKSTPNAWRCIYCRQTIVSVLADWA